MKQIFALIGFLLLMCSAAVAKASDTATTIAETHITALRVAPNTHVDMRRLLSDSAWLSAPKFSGFVQRSPNNGAAPRESTYVQMLFNDDAVYIGVRAEDRNARAIRARLGGNDSLDAAQDRIQVLIDAVGSRKAAQIFSVNAVGATADGMYTADVNSEDYAPDYEFEANAAVDNAGFSVVLRIPFSSLRFSDDKTIPWRILVQRFLVGTDAQTISSSPITNDAHDLLQSLPPVKGIEPPERRPFLKLTTALAARSASGAERGTAFSPSLDIKWRPIDAWVVDATWRPDFSQLELDAPQLTGNTRFAVSFAEKRRFFQESSDLWQMQTAQLYTRSVTKPMWGVRATERSQTHAGSLFVIQDAGGGVVQIPGTWGSGESNQPANRVAAGRLRIDTDLGQVALLAIDRRYEKDRGNNSVAGMDFALNLQENIKLRGQWVGSSTTAVIDSAGELVAGAAQPGSSLWLGFDQKTDTTSRSLRFEHISRNFRNDSGFITQNGVRTISGDVNHIWRQIGPFAELWAYAFGLTSRALTENVDIQHSVRPGLFFLHRSNAELSAEYRGFERLRTNPRSVLHAERYVHLNWKASPTAQVPEISAFLEAGRIVDVLADTAGPGLRSNVKINVLPSDASSIALGIGYQSDSLLARRRFAEANVELSGSYAVTNAQSFRFLATKQRAVRASEPNGQTRTTDAHRDTVSVSWRWVASISQSLFFGYTLDRNFRAGKWQVDRALYLKAVYGFDLF